MEEKKKILVIDDDQAVAELVKLSLEATEKYDVTIETKGSQGFATTKTFNPDLILLDIMFPDVQGSEIAVKLKEDPSTRDIPVVFLTGAVSREETSLRGGVIGGHAFIAKPVSINELIKSVEENIAK
ncbi:MAG: response regulator [Candidatus Omnitrophota bacterium]